MGAGDRAADGISVVDIAGGDHQTIGVEREGLGMTGVGNHVMALGKRLRGQQAAGRSVGAEDGQLHQNLTQWTQCVDEEDADGAANVTALAAAISRGSCRSRAW